MAYVPQEFITARNLVQGGRHVDNETGIMDVLDSVGISYTPTHLNSHGQPEPSLDDEMKVRLMATVLLMSRARDRVHGGSLAVCWNLMADMEFVLDDIAFDLSLDYVYLVRLDRSQKITSN